MISFKANLIRPVSVERMVDEKNYKSIPTSFVELDNTSSQDLQALRKISRSWDNGKSYAWDIYNFFSCSFEEDEDFLLSKRYFAVTTQRQNFEKLSYDRVLGLAQMNDEDSYYMLEFLQVDPDTNFNEFYRKFKGVGAAMLMALKTLFNSKDIVLRPADSNVVEFYVKQGFELLKESKYMRLKR